MFTKRYPIEPHGPKRLSVSRTRTWSEIVVRLDGVELGRNDRETLLNGGVEYTLRDHTVLRVWLELGPRGIPMLFLTRNGMPIPGSEGDPARILLSTLVLIWIFGGLQIMFAASVINNGRADEDIFLIFAAGLILILLGILAWGRSVVAMVLACFLSFGELALLLISEGRIDADTVWRLVFGLGLFGWLLQRGIVAVHRLKAATLPVRHPPQAIHHDSTESNS